MSAKAYRLFLDDHRQPPRDGGVRWIVVRDAAEFEAIIEERGRPEFVAFDFDLGEESTQTGEDVARCLAATCRAKGWSFPPYSVHSSYDRAAGLIAAALAGADGTA